MKRVVKATSVSVFVFYAIVSTFGYITFAINLYPLKDPAAANGLILVAYGYGFQGQLLTYPPVVISVIILLLFFIYHNEIVYNYNHYRYYNKDSNVFQAC